MLTKILQSASNKSISLIMDCYYNRNPIGSRVIKFTYKMFNEEHREISLLKEQ